VTSNLECWFCDKLRIKIKVHRENSVTLLFYPTQIPTLTVLGSNPELRNEKAVTNCPSIARVLLFSKAEVQGGGGGRKVLVIKCKFTKLWRCESFLHGAEDCAGKSSR